MCTGKNPTMRHIGRTHGICDAWLSERFKNKDFTMNICPTDYICADIFTKFFTNKDKWKHALSLIGHCDPQELWGKSTTAAAASPLWATAPTDSDADHLVKLHECLGHQHSPRRLRHYSKQYQDNKTISWKSYLKVKHRYVKCILMLDNNNDVISISPVPRNFDTTGAGPVTITVMHVDQRQARNSRILASLPQPIQDVIASERWDSIPAPEAILRAEQIRSHRHRLPG